MDYYLGCASLVRQLPQSTIEGCVFYVLLILFLAYRLSPNSSADHILAALLSCSAYAATCAVQEGATEQGYLVHARGVLHLALVRGRQVAILVAVSAIPVCYAYALVDEHRMNMELTTVASIVSISLAGSVALTAVG